MNFLRKLLGKKLIKHEKLSNNGLFVPKSGGKRYVVSDIHGCLQTFKALLKKIDLKSNDLLFLLGDYIDRGPNSVGLVDFLRELKQTRNVFLLRGNHEEELLLMDEYRTEHLIESNMQKNRLEGFYNSDLSLKREYKIFFESLHYFVELEDYMLVHAGFDFELEKPFEDTDSMVGIRNWRYHEKKARKKTIVFGHNPKDFGKIIQAIESKEKQIPLDNGCVYKNYNNLGRLLCLCLDDMKLLSQDNIDL